MLGFAHGDIQGREHCCKLSEPHRSPAPPSSLATFCATTSSPSPSLSVSWRSCAGEGGGVLGPGGACFQDCAGRLRTRTRENPGKGGWTKACFIFFCSHIFLVQIHILCRNNCGSPSIHKARCRLPSRGWGPPNNQAVRKNFPRFPALHVKPHTSGPGPLGGGSWPQTPPRGLPS